MARNVDRIAQAAAGQLPDQVAIVEPESWEALADNEYYNSASLAAFQAAGQWAGFACRYVAEPELRAGALRRCKAAILWQAQRQGDLAADTLQQLKEFVEQGGTLLCDLPLLQTPAGDGPAGDWADLAGFTATGTGSTNRVAFADSRLGRYAFEGVGEAFPGRGLPRDLGAWRVTPRPGTQVIADEAGRPAVLIHPVGKGRVVTCCFRLCLAGPDADNQGQRALLLQRLLSAADLAPLVDAPWVEKTIAPQDHGGLLVTAYNPRTVAVYSPMQLPGRKSPSIVPLCVPVGASVGPDHITLPAGEWVVFAVEGR